LIEKGIFVNVRGGSDQITGFKVEEIIEKRYINFIDDSDGTIVFESSSIEAFLAIKWKRLPEKDLI